MARGLYRVEILPAALKALAAIPGPWQDRLRAAIRELAHDPEPADSIPMTGRAEGLRRRRVGTYRIVYRVKAGRLLVIMRKISFGTRCPAGSEAHSVLPSLLTTARRQGKDGIDFLTTLLTQPLPAARAALLARPP